MRKPWTFALWVASLGLGVGTAVAEPPAVKDGQLTQPKDALKREDAAAAGKPRVYGAKRHTSKYVVTNELRTIYPKKSGERELVVRYQDLDDGYLVYTSELSEAMRATIAAYKKIPLRKVPRQTEHRIRVDLEDRADLRRLRRRKGENVRLKLKQDRSGRYMVRDVLPINR